MILFVVRYLFLALDVCRFLLIVYALLSWFPNAAQSRLGQWVRFLAEPILKPFRALPLQIGGLDFTVVVAILALQVLGDLVVKALFLL